MTTRSSLVLGAAIVLGCLALGSGWDRPTLAQDKPAVPAGRYQVMGGVANGVVGGNTSGRNDVIVVTDTATGQCWAYQMTEPGWKSLGAPAGAK
jgi:hypothetical protein